MNSCKKCFRSDAHNEGCPVADPTQQKAWSQGFNAGWDGSLQLQAWEYRFYSKAFILGWLAGKAEVDQAIDAAVEDRANYGEWL